MLLNLSDLIKKHSLAIRGVIHVGAHYGQEYKDYVSNNISPVVFIEPCQGAFEKLKSQFSNIDNVRLVNIACGEEESQMVMNVETANSGQSNSLLTPALHLRQYPDIKFTGKETVTVRPLDSLGLNGAYNFLNIDVQGFELNVLKGALKTLKGIDYIYTEVNRDEVYEGCARIEEIESFLFPLGFVRADIDWGGDTWGDALYIKSDSKIVIVPNEFRTPIKHLYPPDNTIIFEEWYCNNVTDADHSSSMPDYLPVFWTGYYVNHNYGNDQLAINKLQDYIDSLDKEKKYYTIVQFDDGIKNDLSKLNIKVFAMNGECHYRLPLLCTPHKTVARQIPKRRYLLNFIGRQTHEVRTPIFKILDRSCYISSKPHSMDSYCHIINDSHFTLCPRGYGKTSFRIQEALQYGSIPVYISDEFYFPHSLDFNSYGVVINSTDADKVKQILQAIPEAEIKKMQAKGKEIYQNYFSYQRNKEIILSTIIQWSNHN